MRSIWDIEREGGRVEAGGRAIGRGPFRFFGSHRSGRLLHPSLSARCLLPPQFPLRRAPRSAVCRSVMRCELPRIACHATARRTPSHVFGRYLVRLESRHATARRVPLHASSCRAPHRERVQALAPPICRASPIRRARRVAPRLKPHCEPRREPRPVCRRFCAAAFGTFHVLIH